MPLRKKIAATDPLSWVTSFVAWLLSLPYVPLLSDQLTTFAQKQGVGSERAAEGIVHSVRTYLASNRQCLALKLDFKNAFNSHKRGVMMREVQQHALELFPLIHKAYRAPIHLMFGSSTSIMSSSGCQQGDIAAPMVFSLLLQPHLL